MCGEGETCVVSIRPLSTAVDDSPSADEAFTCQICLDLIYKPVVQSCGHIFCFWCARLSMNAKRQSQCPLCRRPYLHFPRVCQMLHFFFMKAWPEEYGRRTDETKAMEEIKRVFSPRFRRSPFDSPHKIDKASRNLRPQLERSRSAPPGEANCQSLDVATVIDLCKPSDSRLQEPPSSNGENVDTVPALQASKAERHTFSKEDFLCASCGNLLYRPVALNCGKVFCESCVMTANSSTLACPSCRTHHPGGPIHVCLNLHSYLERLFPMCYKERANEIEILQRSKEVLAQRITDSDRECDAPGNIELNETERQIVHIGAGCDGCGMFPIVGHRYHCRDCSERVGYDLCGSCYRARDNLGIGRFNQHHTPDHRMEEILSDFRRSVDTQGTLLNLNLDNGVITRRRRQQVLIDFDDYIDSFM